MHHELRIYMSQGSDKEQGRFDTVCSCRSDDDQTWKSELQAPQDQTWRMFAILSWLNGRCMTTSQVYCCIKLSYRPRSKQRKSIAQ